MRVLKLARGGNVMAGTKEFTRTDALALVGSTITEFNGTLREMTRTICANKPENMSNEAVRLGQRALDFETASFSPEFIMEGIPSLNEKGLVELLIKCRSLSKLYNLKVKIPEGELGIQFDLIYWFKTSMKQSALARLSMNEQELPKLREHLIDEANKFFDGKGSDFDAIFQAKKKNDELSDEMFNTIEMQKLEFKNVDEYNKLRKKYQDLKQEQANLHKDFPLIDFIQDRSRGKRSLLIKDIDEAINKIAKAQANVRSKIIDGSFPVWQMTPVVLDVLSTQGLTPAQIGEIQKWIASQKKWDTITDILSFAIPVALAIGCFFISGGTSLTLLAIRTSAQVASAAINVASGVNEFNEANMQSDMIYAQTLGGQKIVEGTKSEADRARIMGFINLIMSAADIVDAVKAAKLLGKYEAFDAVTQSRLLKLGKKGVSVVDTLTPEQIAALSRIKNSDEVMESLARNIDDKGIKNLSSLPPDRIDEALRFKPESVDDSIQWLNKTENPIDEIEIISRSKNIDNRIEKAKSIIPPVYYSRAQSSIRKMPKEDQIEVLDYMDELFNEYKSADRVMQDHHWIAQSKVDILRYPFLKSPPAIDLIHDQRNLNLIVGHVGVHCKTYFSLVDKELSILAKTLSDAKKNGNNSYTITN